MAQDTFEYQAVADHVTQVLRVAFPDAAIQTERGWQGRVHVRIISPQFNGLREADKQEMVWTALRASLGEDAQAVSLVLVFGMDELP
jgi:stress-induced morphogen